MDPDKYQQAWRALSSQTRVTVDTELLRKEVERNQRTFRASIFWRDFREVGAAVVMVPVWLWMGIKMALPWTWYLGVPSMIWVAGFIVLDRLRHKRKPSERAESLLTTVNESLAEAEHQIWLLRNVAWWYLLPLTLPIVAFFAQVAWRSTKGWLEFALSFGLETSFVAALYYLIYCLNQRAVRKQLVPRRQELRALIASLTDEATDELSTTNGSEEVPKAGWLRRVLIIACLCFVGYELGILALHVSGYRSEGAGYPRLAPFAAVRWQESQPEVKLDDAWYRLISLDDIPAADIVAFSQRTYGDRWQMRFEEDLVEVLTRMEHPPQDTVKLVVQAPGYFETQVFEKVPMTAANRQAIKQAALDRANANP